MLNRFCDSQIEGEYNSHRLDCIELSIGGDRVQCPYLESHIQLRYIEGKPQLHIPDPNIKGLHACIDFVPTSETRLRLLAKLSQQPNL